MPRLAVSSALSAVALTSFAVVMLRPTHVAADITSATWTNNTLFHYRVQHMPDIDQVRATLPCGGSIHCVPTCATNMVMYTANHGFPDLQPEPGYWEGDTNYGAASDAVLLMGLFMQTSCAGGGTSGGPANNGLNFWINDLSEVDGLIVNDHLSLGSFSPTHASIGKSLCAGRVGSVSYGRYTVTGSIDGIPVVTRGGGHCTTAVKVRRNGSSRDLWVRDPSSDEGNPNSQSPFVNDVWSVSDLTVIVMPGMTMKTMTAIDYTLGQSPIKLIDGHRTITPAQGYSWDSSLGAVVFIGSQNFLNPTLPPPTHFPPPVGTAVAALAWHDPTGEILVVCTGPTIFPSLRTIDPQTGASQTIATPFLPSLVATGRSDNVYASNGDVIMMIVRPAPPNAPPMTPRPLPHTVHAMTYDDARDDVALVSRTDRKLMRIDRTLAGVISVQDIPTFVPMGTRVQIAINPQENGIVYLWSDASNQIWRLFPGPNGLSATPLSLPAAPLPRSLDFNDRGHLFVSNAGTLVEFEPHPNTPGAWLVDTTSAFVGLPADRDFRMMRTRTNFEAGVHDVPAWTTNIDPSELDTFPTAPDCAADIAPNLNTDDIVNVADLLAVITAWGPCTSAVRCVADIDDNDVVDVSDLLRVITAWGPCP